MREASSPSRSTTDTNTSRIWPCRSDGARPGGAVGSFVSQARRVEGQVARLGLAPQDVDEGGAALGEAQQEFEVVEVEQGQRLTSEAAEALPGLLRFVRCKLLKLVSKTVDRRQTSGSNASDPG